MPKRFSRYRFALKANGGDAASGSALDRFKRYQSGETRPTYTRDSNSLPGEFNPIYLIPFGESEDIYYLTQISDRAQQQLTLVGGANELNYILPANIANAQTSQSNKYTPAAAVVFDPTGTPTTQTSQITGARYKKQGGASYTFPFGKDAGATGVNATFKGRALDIKRAVVAAGADNTVSFRPEILRAF